MYKLIFLLFILLCLNVTAQKSKITSAINLKDAGKYEEALKTIQSALDPTNTKAAKTINWPRTWEARGEIFQAIALSKDENTKKLSNEPLSEAYLSYKKAIELDLEKKFAKSLKIKLTLLVNDFLNQGINSYNDKNYKIALNSFENVLDIQKLPLLRADNPGSIDTAVIYNAGIAAQFAEDYDKAIRYFTEAEKTGYNRGKIYNPIFQSWLMKKDTLGSLPALKRGFEKYPEDIDILNNIIQAYLYSKQHIEALKYLKMAIQKNPENADYYYAEGSVLGEIGDIDKAIQSYEKALSLNPELFNAWFNAGVLYYNQGVKQVDAANALTTNDIKGFEKEMKKADIWWEKALPCFEKCHQINPNDKPTLESLKNLYYRLKKMDKYEEIVKKIG